MKKTRMIAVVLAIAMLLGALTGCSLFKPTAMSLSKKTIENFAKVKSFQSNIKAEYAGAATISGMDVDLVMNADCDLDAVISSGVSRADGTVSTTLPLIGNVSIPFESYQQTGNDGVTAYTKIHNSQWIKTESKAQEEENPDRKFDIRIVLGVLQKISSGDIKAELAEETEMMGDREVYRMDVSISGELLGELIKAAAESEGEQSGIPENLNLTGADAEFVFYIFKDTSLPARIFCDCTELGNIMVQQAGTEEFSARADKFQITMQFNEYDTIDEIKIPDEVTREAVESEDLNIMDLIGA